LCVFRAPFTRISAAAFVAAQPDKDEAKIPAAKIVAKIIEVIVSVERRLRAPLFPSARRAGQHNGTAANDDQTRGDDAPHHCSRSSRWNRTESP
jgi:hypothetical protein